MNHIALYAAIVWFVIFVVSLIDKGRHATWWYLTIASALIVLSEVVKIIPS